MKRNVLKSKRETENHSNGARIKSQTSSENIFAKTVLFIVGICLACSLCGQTASDYRAKAESGDAIAQYNLGVCYYNGEGVTKDLYEAA